MGFPLILHYAFLAPMPHRGIETTSWPIWAVLCHMCVLMASDALVDLIVPKERLAFMIPILKV
jgi:hypothetical protein